jgi:hypothetical protein
MNGACGECLHSKTADWRQAPFRDRVPGQYRSELPQRKPMDPNQPGMACLPNKLIGRNPRRRNRQRLASG